MIQAIPSAASIGNCNRAPDRASGSDFASVLSALGNDAAGGGQAASTEETSASTSLAPAGSMATGKMSIARIRDLTDQMAIEGKLTIKQQMALIGAGLMDPNPADPSYQPTTDIQVGYSRSDGGSYDLVGILQDAATAAALAGLNQTAAIYKSIAQAFQDYTASPQASPAG